MTGQRALELFRESGAGFLGPDYQILDEAILRQAAALHAPSLPWTVNDAATMGLLFEAPGVMG